MTIGRNKQVTKGDGNTQIINHGLIVIAEEKTNDPEFIRRHIHEVSQNTSEYNQNKQQDNATLCLKNSLAKLVSTGNYNDGKLVTEVGAYLIGQLDELLKQSKYDKYQYESLIALYLALVDKDTKVELIEARKIWDTLKALTSSDILVLRTNYKLYISDEKATKPKFTSSEEWVRIICKETGIKLQAVVRDSQQQLQNRGLITTAMNEFEFKRYRMSQLGVVVGELLEKGNEHLVK
jgi:hypothetical protein